MADTKEIARLKKKRGGVRTSVTKQIKNIETEIEKETISDSLEESLELLIEYSNELEQLDSELQKLLEINEVDGDINTSMEYKEKIIIWKFRARKKLSQKKVIPTDSDSNNFSLNKTFEEKLLVNLPKLSIPKFYGEISQWLSFWNSYESAIHNNTSLDKISKFNYLKSYLSGTALQTVEGYAITADNYDNAITGLKERFACPEILINQHISNILDITPLKHSSDVKTFRKLYDKIVAEIRSLETLKILSDSYSTILCPMIIKMLPSDLVFEFNKEVQNSTYEINRLIKFLSIQLIARERSSFSKTANQKSFTDNRQSRRELSPKYFHREEKNEKIKTTASDLFSSELKHNKHPNCIFCGNWHESINDCVSVLKLSLEQKRQVLRKHGLCFRCAGKHLSKYCVKHIQCNHCGGRHLTIFCFSKNKTNEKSCSENNNEKKYESSVLTNNSSCKVVLLQTLIVYVNNSNNFVRVILDLGSQKSYVSKYVAEVMKLKCIGHETIIHGLFGGIEKTERHKKYSIQLSSIDKSFTFELEVMDQKKICSPIPKLKNFDCIHELKRLGIVLSDVAINENCCLFENIPNEIHILIGADCASKLLTGEVKHLSNGMMAMRTKLGWTILGNEDKSRNSNILSSLHSSDFDITDHWSRDTIDSRDSGCTSSDGTLTALSLHVNDVKISDLWSLDCLGIKEPATTQTKKEIDQATEEYFLRSLKRDNEGRYQVSLPWLDNHSDLPDNRFIAEKRLGSCIRNLKAKNCLKEYQNVFREWVDEEIIEQVENSETLKCHYLPHRAVFRENTTTNIRPVFDASAKGKNSKSLNDCIEKGPNFLELIPAIINRFRVGSYGVIADIRRAFLQISVDPKDRDFLRFLWWEDGDPAKLKIFRHRRVVFGVNASPFLLSATINYHLENVPEHLQAVAKKLKASMYVDNCVASLDTVEQLNQFIEESKEIMFAGKFDLRGWKHNKPENEISILNNSDENYNEDVSVLGLKWNLLSDTLSCDVKEEFQTEKMTKRNILSLVHRIFDPIGFTSPVTLIPKQMLQECWKMKVTWDEVLPDSILRKFLEWIKHLRYLKEIKIPRRLPQLNEDASMHVFCDASKSAYATCIFLRASYGDSVKTQLVQARSKVAPVKKITIPRLELLACTIGARLALTVKNDLKLENIPVTYWTDSANALYWIKGTDNWATFVYNRVQEIRQLSDPLNWKHIAGPLNPADLPSRGCNSRELVKTRWWEGPNWLKLPPDEWPVSSIDPDLEIVNSEKRKTIVSATNSESDTLQYATRISSYRKIIRVMAWIQRFYNNCKNKEDKKKGRLNLEEINQAEKTILRKIQEQFFKEEQKLNLQTFIDNDGLIKVKTRISLREDLETFRFPILLPCKHHIVNKLIFEKHVELCHAGLQVLMSTLRENFWICKSRKTIRQAIRICVKCKRFENHPLENISAPLPKDRVRDALVFEVCGTDLCGPLYLKNGSKCWIVIFTCAIYRATHFELVTSLSTENFLLALRRFISRRGRPTTIYSDNGTNLVGTANELKFVDWKEIEDFATLKKISWKLNPPASPWWGGFWERLIGMLKRILRKVIGNASLKYEELYTILCDAESLINSRPLTYISEEPEDLVPLTPSMFLQEIIEVGVPDLDLIDRKKLKGRFGYKQRLRQDLRLRFRNEYLGQLKDFSKTRKECFIREGDIVLIGDSNTKKINWPLAKVVKTFPGKDGRVRVVELKTKNGTFLRPVQRLYPLEVSETDNSSQPLRNFHLSPPSIHDDNCVPSSDDSQIPDSVHTKNNSQEPTIRRSRYGRVLKYPDKL